MDLYNDNKLIYEDKTINYILILIKKVENIYKI